MSKLSTFRQSESAWGTFQGRYGRGGRVAGCGGGTGSGHPVQHKPGITKLRGACLT